MENIFNSVFQNSFALHEKLAQARLIIDDEAYFKIRFFKAERFEKLRDGFSRFSHGSNRRLNLLIGSNFGFANWGNIQKYLPKATSVEFLDADFFHGDISDSDFQSKCEYLNGKVILTTNHDIVKSDPQSLINLIKFYLKCENTVFTGWDWDNHHNVQISSIFAMCSDIYFPSQRGHEYELSKVAPRNKFIMPSAYEWSNEFLSEHMSVILDTPRKSSVFGVFNYYDKFKYRNQIITTLNTQIPDIKFIDDFKNYQSKSEVEKLTEWASHKWHWLVPTLNAVSVRAYYSLIAGTGVILPVEFRGFDEFKNIDSRDVIWFDEKDVLDVQRVLKKIEENFTKDGKEGILRRHFFARNAHNLHVRVQEIHESILDYLL